MDTTARPTSKQHSHKEKHGSDGWTNYEHALVARQMRKIISLQEISNENNGNKEKKRENVCTKPRTEKPPQKNKSHETPTSASRTRRKKCKCK
jgi:hypothetical protein